MRSNHFKEEVFEWQSKHALFKIAITSSGKSASLVTGGFLIAGEVNCIPAKTNKRMADMRTSFFLRMINHCFFMSLH
jgi:hypothetical protein